MKSLVTTAIIFIAAVCAAQTLTANFPHDQDGWALPSPRLSCGTVWNCQQISFPVGPGLGFSPTKSYKQFKPWYKTDGIQVQTVDGVSYLVMQTHEWPFCTSGCMFVGNFMEHGIPATATVEKRPLHNGSPDGFVYLFEGDLEGDFTVDGQTGHYAAHFYEETWPEIVTSVADVGALTIILTTLN